MKLEDRPAPLCWWCSTSLCTTALMSRAPFCSPHCKARYQHGTSVSQEMRRLQEENRRLRRDSDLDRFGGGR